VEKEINDWSGMSLGDDDNISNSGSMEKFKIICSLCGLEKTVPFKPESGRPVYCKECMAKIKSGEVKVQKGSDNQIKHDEIEFFKPLADLGIEFKQKNGKIEEIERYPERVEKPHHMIGKPNSPIPAKAEVGKPGILGTIKKVFTKNDHKEEKPKSNAALREVLNKTLETKPAPEPATAVAGVPPQAAISLDSLKNKIQEEIKKPANTGGNFVPSKDRAATPEEMNKLKNLIEAKSSVAGSPDASVEAFREKTPASSSIPVSPPPMSQSTPIPQKPTTKEVPEDVLRKILE
jgi:CxxC-x17-CxxC domain-containing protein